MEITYPRRQPISQFERRLVGLLLRNGTGHRTRHAIRIDLLRSIGAPFIDDALRTRR